MPCRPLSVIVGLSISLAAAQPDQPLFAFSSVDAHESFQAKLPNGLLVRIEKNELGWEVGVFKGKSQDSLLYPQHNWHGAWPCQISAWSHKRKTFPDLRVIPIRGYRQSIVIDLSNAISSGEPDHEVFTGGRISISLRPSA
jgi:hypothetical protein